VDYLLLIRVCLRAETQIVPYSMSHLLLAAFPEIFGRMQKDLARTWKATVMA
jgi:hypothetical protein